MQVHVNYITYGSFIDEYAMYGGEEKSEEEMAPMCDMRPRTSERPPIGGSLSREKKEPPVRSIVWLLAPNP